MTTKPPPKRRPAARSGAKSPARKPGTPYDEATKATAVAQLEADGMAATHKATGIPKATLTRWAKAAGVDLGAAARARTAAATDAVRARSAEVRLSTVELLEHHVAQAGDYLATVAGVNALAARLIVDAGPDAIAYTSTMAGPLAVVSAGAAADVKKIADALATLPLAVRDAEGLITRAIHDLQLLSGQATERGELVVEFTVPRPTTAATVEELVEFPALTD